MIQQSNIDQGLSISHNGLSTGSAQMINKKTKNNKSHPNQLTTNALNKWLIKLAAHRNTLDSIRLAKVATVLITDDVYPYYDSLYPVKTLKQLPENDAKIYYKQTKLLARELSIVSLFCLQHNALPMALSLLFEAIALNRVEILTWDFDYISSNLEKLSPFQTALALILGIGCSKNIAEGVKQLRSIATNDYDYANACFLQGVLIQHELITGAKYSDKHYFKQAKKNGLVQLHYRYPEVKPNCLFFTKNKTEYITEKALIDKRRSILF